MEEVAGHPGGGGGGREREGKILSLTYVADRLVIYFVGSLNIFEGNVKLTLGMIWTLIQKYQLRMKGKVCDWKLKL